MAKEIKEEQGKCPKCSEHSLDYGAIAVQDDLVYYPFTCEYCGHEDKEWYNMEFCGNNT